MIGGLYLIRLSDEHFYGGRAGSFEGRWAYHLKLLQRGTHWNPHAQNVFNLYGRFEPSSLKEIPYHVDRVIAEQAWLDEHWGKPGCLNISKKADGPVMKGAKFSEETCRRISESKKGNQNRLGATLSSESRAKISASLRGRHPSEETCAKLSAALMSNQRSLGKTASPETRAKLSAAKIGKPKSEETRRRMSEAQKGRKVSEEGCRAIALAKTGTKHSEETKAKMSASRKAHLAEHGDPRLRRKGTNLKEDPQSSDDVLV